MKEETKEIIKEWMTAQKAGCHLPCPRCGSVRKMQRRLCENAFSRRAEVYVCPPCGAAEAMEDMMYRNDTSRKMSVDNWFIARFVIGDCDTPYPQSNGKWQVTAKKTFEVSPEDIDDILSTAFNGGISYWCSEAEPVDGIFGHSASEQIARGGTLKLYDCESSDTYELNLEKMLRGIRLWVENEQDEYGVLDGNELDCSNVDATAADAMVQYALFGEIIYG